MSVDLEAQFARIDKAIEDASDELTEVVSRTLMLYEEAGALAGMKDPDKWASYAVHSVLSSYVGGIAAGVQEDLISTLGQVIERNSKAESND